VQGKPGLCSSTTAITSGPLPEDWVVIILWLAPPMALGAGKSVLSSFVITEMR
jgi:hypothetical protein